MWHVLFVWVLLGLMGCLHRASKGGFRLLEL